MANLTIPVSAHQVLSSYAGDPAGFGDHELGTLGVTNDGRMFRYARAGATSLIAGNVVQAPAQIANHLALTPAAASIGATQVTVTLGATLATANQYAGGWLCTHTTPGEGYMYLIKGHPAALSGGTLTLTLDPADGLNVALTASSVVDLVSNPFSAVIQAPVTTATGSPIGVAPFPIVNAQYGWIQTHGPAATLITGTPAVGQEVVGVGAVAGAAAIQSGTLPVIGFMMVTGVDTKIQPVFLNLD